MGPIRRAGRVAFSLWAWSVAFAWMGVLAVATAVPRLMGVPYARLHPTLAAGFHGVLAITGTRVRIRRHPALDPRRPAVYCQNHVNLLDAHVASGAIPGPFCGVMNAWQLRVPIYGWCMRLSCGIGVDRRLPSAELRAGLARDAAARRDLGLSVLVFPEGHRTRTGQVGGFRMGVFEMARAAGMPVVPIAVRGARAVNQKGTLLLSPGHVVEVLVGPPRETAGLDDAALARLAEDLRAWIADFVETGDPPRGWPDAA